MGKYLDLAEQYDAGKFDYGKLVKSGIIPADFPQEKFETRQENFHKNYDDWYRPYYAKYGDKRKEINAVRATVSYLTGVSIEAFSHMDSAYMNCAISSGTGPHLDAAVNGYHTTDKLDLEIGSEYQMQKNIIPASHRSLDRAYKVQELWPEIRIITPTSLEGTTRVLKNQGSEMTYGASFESADYMSFWNPQIDFSKGFIVDDPIVDMPLRDIVRQEIKLAKANSPKPRERKPIVTTDWANSRNSIFENARGNYVRFGLNPLRPDNKMDMRIYSEEHHTLRPATLLDCILPMVQNIARWAPQGIATDTACQTVARFFHLHHMRTDPAYNAAQEYPLELDTLEDLIRNPSQEEIHAFKELEKAVKPFLKKYCAHLLKPSGIAQEYHEAIANAPLKQKDLGEKSVKWQRENIPTKLALKIWDLTVELQSSVTPQPAFDKRPPIENIRIEQGRQHDFKHLPFDQKDEDEIWPDHPFDDLTRMMKTAANMTVATLELGILPKDSPNFHGYRADMKRGKIGADQARLHHVQDLSLLPGVMGKEFHEKVTALNLKIANDNTGKLRAAFKDTGAKIPAMVLGSQQYKAMSSDLERIRTKLAGPGFAADSNFRLAIEMQMLRRSYSHITFADGWQNSEDSVRMMMQATKIEFGKIDRPGNNNTELSVLKPNGDYISLFERYDQIKSHLDELLNDPQLVKYLDDGKSEALQKLGVRNISLTLARMVEIYDCLIDPLHNDKDFELQKVRNQKGFSENIHEIHKTRQDTIDSLVKNWAWLWKPDDLKGLPQIYKDAWRDVHGKQALNAGPEVTDDRGLSDRIPGY